MCDFYCLYHLSNDSDAKKLKYSEETRCSLCVAFSLLIPLSPGQICGNIQYMAVYHMVTLDTATRWRQCKNSSNPAHSDFKGKTGVIL